VAGSSTDETANGNAVPAKPDDGNGSGAEASESSRLFRLQTS